MQRKRDMPVKIVDRKDDHSDLKFWRGRSPEERIDAVEFLRMQYYALSGYKDTPRFIPNVEIRPLHK